MENNLSKDLSKLRREESGKSVYAFAKLYLKEHMQYEPSAAHREIYSLLDGATIRRGIKLAVAAPRFFGKSTTITLDYVLYCICHSKEKFIVILSNTAAQARQLLDIIMKELMENELIKVDFPEIFVTKHGVRQLRWREGELITGNGIKIIALGSNQQIRGIRFGKFRPTLVIADDLEDSENTFSLETLDKRREWYNKSVLNVGSEKTNYIFVGNLYHPHSLLSEYVSPDQNPIWVKKVYAAIVVWPKNMNLWDKWNNIYNHRDEFEGASGPAAARILYEKNKSAMDEGAQLLWEARYKLYELMQMWAENELSFMSEMQNLPRNPANCIFDVDKIVYWDADGKSMEDLLRSLGKDVKFFIACDPSLGMSTVKGDPSAIIVLAKDETTKTLYIIIADIKIRPIEEITETILAYFVRFKPVKIAIEANQFQRVLIDMVKKDGQKMGLYPNVEPINNKDDKTSRVQTLRPRFNCGNLQCSKQHRQLLEEIRYFPKGRHDDGLDALEMAVRISNDNGFSFGFAGGDKPAPNEPQYPTKEGLVPRRFYDWPRRPPSDY